MLVEAVAPMAAPHADAAAMDMDQGQGQRHDQGQDRQQEDADPDADPDPEQDACNQRKFFQEREEVLRLLGELIAAQFAAAASPVDAEFDRKFHRVIWIFDQYMEQPHLLDPHLPDVLAPVVTEIQRVLCEVAEERAMRAAASSQAFPCQLYSNPKLQRMCHVIYALCKVRGSKRVVKLLPHEVRMFEPTLAMLQSQDPSDHTTWQMRYVLLLWLSMLSLVPFDLRTIDSDLGSAASTQGASTSLVASLLSICKGCLAEAGMTQSAAAVCLARLLSRPDVEAHDLHPFLLWANDQLREAAQPQTQSQRMQQFRVTGVMLCLANLAKYAPRESHIAASRVYFGSVMTLITTLIAQDATSDGPTSSTLHRKLSMKLVQRLGLLYLPPRVQPWRYKRGLRSLELTMSGTNASSSSHPDPESAMSNTKSATPDSADSADADPSAMLDAVHELEQVVDVLLCGLRDKDTIVRWSAAKGIGRITSRLPFEYADDVVQSVLELFVATEGDSAWHGASLATAELARRGVLLPHRLTDAVDCVARALQYDVRRGTHSIGAHVRDAACYACWSFARAYEPVLLRPHLDKTLAPSMLILCVFDRELNCRRAASAAFQESVGRQGRANFPHGIEVLTKADYFSVANVRHAYLEVSVFIAAKIAAYRDAMLEHLVARKLQHWDAAIRLLAASACGKIAALDPPLAQHHILPRLMDLALAESESTEVFARHGALLAIADVLDALLDVPAFVDGQVQARVKLVPLEIDKRRLFRGRGGELVRVAVCRLISSIARAGCPLMFAQVRKYFRLLEECVVHPIDQVRDAAVLAMAAFTSQYVPKMLSRGSPPVLAFLATRVPTYLNEGVLSTIKVTDANGDGEAVEAVVLNPNVAVRRGMIRAVGAITTPLLQPHVADCMRILFRAALLQQQTVDERDAVSRVAAIRAIVDLCARVHANDHQQAQDEANAMLDLIGLEVDAIETLVACVEQDYSVDERGDVGSWVRKEAMLGIETLLLDKMPRARRLQIELVGRHVQTRYGEGRIIRVLLASDQSDQQDATDTDAAGDTDADPVCQVQFDKPALGFFYFAPAGIGQLHLSKLTIVPQDANDADFAIPSLANRLDQADDISTKSIAKPKSKAFARRIPPAVMAAVCSALAKQLAEKLDNMRAIAGQILFRLLHATQPRVDGIPDRFQLASQILPPTLAINWSMAHDTFPLVVRMMDIPAYLDAVAAGLVISIGGLTESVVKASRAALLQWLQEHRTAQHLGLLQRFANFLVTLLRRHQQDDRVTLPLLTTMAMLLDQGALAYVFTRGSETEETTGTAFGDALYDALKDELHRTASIQKLAAGVAVLVGLLPSDDATQRKALRALVMFLAHRFPRIRKLTADRLYTRLLLHEEVLDDEQYEAVVDVLSRTVWDGSIAAARDARTTLLTILGMEAPTKKRRIETPPAAAPDAVDGDGTTDDS